MDDDEEGDAGPTAHPPSLSRAGALVGVAPPGSGAPTGAVRGKEKRRVSRKDIMMGRLLRLVSQISESTCGGAQAGTASARGRRGHKRALQAQVRPASEVEHYGGAGSGNSELVPVAQGSPKRIMMQLGLHPLSQSARAIQLVKVVRANFCFDPSGKVTAFLSTVTKPIKAVGVIGVAR